MGEDPAGHGPPFAAALLSRATRHAGARLTNGLHNDRRFANSETRSTLILRDTDSESTVPGNSLIKIFRKATLLILREPIGIIEATAYTADRFANCRQLGRQREIHTIGALLLLV
jgi:hypothetical protein